MTQMRAQALFKNTLPTLAKLTYKVSSFFVKCLSFVAAAAVVNFRNMLDDLLPGCYTVSEFPLGQSS